MSDLEIHAHRGIPALFPENTLAGFEKAMELGAQVLELDVVVCKEHKLLISHDPYMRAGLCLDTKGNPISKEDELKHNIYEMSFDRIQLYDAGSLKSEKFPEQINGQHFKPLMLDLIKIVKKYPGVKLNIEVKSERKWYGEFQPDVSDYAEIVKKEIRALRQLGIPFMIQSFDTAFLNQLWKLDPGIEYGLLIEGKLDIEESLNRLLFKPAYYNPDHDLLTPEIVQELKSREMKVVPWTVNNLGRGKELVQMGVDGLITDKVGEFINKLSL